MKTDNIKIVIVEDDAFYGEILRKYVQQVFYSMIPESDVSVEHFISAKECLECLDPETNMFLLDYNLSGDHDDELQSGLDLLKKIKRICPNADTVIVTGYNDFSTINKFTLEGADRYILKNENTPIRINTILRQLIRRSQVNA
jgi:response regulator of citrate/malate metabolism